MKKYVFFFLIGFVPMLFSCAKEMPVNDVEETPIAERDPWTPYPLTEVAAASGAHSVEAGHDAETKSHLDVSGNVASVLWDTSDKYIMMGYEGESYQTATYTNTATESSVRATFTTSETIAYTSNKLHSLYPVSAFHAPSTINAGENLYLPVTIPTTQTATIGNVAPGANIAYAQSDTQNEDLHFKKAVSIIKFKLSGAAVSSVTSVSIKGTSYLTGTFFLLLPGSKTPAFDAGFAGNDASLSATLNGTFTAGKDYYIAVVPGVQDGFMMTFSNGAGKVIKKTSSKSLTLNRGSITDFGTINIGDSFPETDPTVIKYKTASASAPKPVTIVVLPDGYQKTELDTYETLAKAGIDALFDTEPYNKYENYFNVYILKVASNESGANITNGSGVITTHKDCYFQSKWGEDKYDDMAANSERVFAFVENNCPDVINGTVKMEDVSILILINDTRFGGRCHSYSNGQNYCMVPTTAGTLNWSYPSKEPTGVNSTPWNYTTISEEVKTAQHLKNSGTWHNTLVHEFGGHAFGRLGDEYWYDSSLDSASDVEGHDWTVPMNLNISNTNNEGSVLWHELISNKSELVDINGRYSRIGVFQGGDVSMFYRWRSERISCMIDNRFYFSTWQRWLIVNRIRTLAGYSDADYATFKASDVMYDPVTDGSPSLLPDGLVNSISPRPVPMCPPPVMHVVD